MFGSVRSLVRGLVVLAAFAPLVGFAQFNSGEAAAKANAAPAFTEEVRGEILDGVTLILKERAFVPGLDFAKWDTLLETNREQLLKVENENSFASGVNRLLREFGISHVGLRTPRSREFRQTGLTTGLGVGAQFENGAMIVRSVAEGSPAAQAGLSVGDKIVEINGAAVTAESRLQAGENEELKLKFIRGETAPREIAVKAGRYEVVVRDQLKWVDDKFAVIKINSFSRGYDRAALDKMVEEASKAEGIVIDLRNNGGGAVTNLAHMLGLFIDANEPVGTFVNRQMMQAYLTEKQVISGDVKEIAQWGQSKYRPRTPAVKRYEGKVAVLINRGSASASEIFSAAMKELRGAHIVGQATRGAVLASTYGRLAGGFELQFPVSDYVTIKGQRLEGDPVTPTIEVQVTRGIEGDPVLDAAIKAFLSSQG